MEVQMKFIKKHKKLLIIGIIVIILGAFLFWPKDVAAVYDSTLVEKGDLVTYYSFSGNVNANTRKDYIASQKVNVEDFFVEVGDHVEEGDLLYKLKSDDLENSLKQIEASWKIAQNNYSSTVSSVESQRLSVTSNLEMAQRSYDLAETNLNNYSQLYELGGVSLVELESMQTSFMQAKSSLDAAQLNYDTTINVTIPTTLSTAKASLDSSRASYETNKESLGDMEVRAEVAGEVTYKANLHEELKTGDTIMTITNYDSLVASIRVDEYDVSALTIGKEADVYVSSLDKNIKGAVSNLSKTANTVSGIAFFNAEVEIPQSEFVLEGMSVEVRIQNKEAKNTLLLPMEALSFKDNGQPYVLIRDGKTIAEQPIEVGISDGLIVEVTNGLEEGQEVFYTKNFMGGMMFSME